MKAELIDDSASAGAPTREALSRLRQSSPAKLRRRLSGDLDTIVLRAMHKEPERRYASVEQFAEDVRRHLDGRPVLARRDSLKYRAGKFATRHKLGVIATALILAAVLAGVTATIREARIAAANQRRAEQRFNDVRKLANSLMFEIHDAIRDLPGSTPARRLLVTRALEYLDSLSAQSKGDISLQKELAAAYRRVGDVLGYPYGANLGDKAGALQSYRKALAILDSLARARPNDAQLQHDLVADYFAIAQVNETSGNFAEALESMRKAMPTAERMAAGSNNPEWKDMFAGSYYFTAFIQIQTGDSAAAFENYQRSASIREAALRANPGNFFLRTHLAADYGGLAKCLEMKHDLPNAIQMQSKSAAILEEISKANPTNATLSEYLGESINRLATYRDEHGDFAASMEAGRQSHRIFASLLAADPKNALAKSNFGFSDNGIARGFLALGKPASAIPIFRESIAAFEEMSPRTASDRYLRSGLADAYSGLGTAYSRLATGNTLSRDQQREYWGQSRSSCQRSLALWNDKEKRGELESAERDQQPLVAQCIAASEAHLQVLSARKDGPR